ncbi:hypothetical protein BB559_005340 [Furculomyces boomerangus]|uniref:Kynureninase n=2 Tax=Harpellales TaxID=61421 RepID=A0A2T9Y7D8_9FUNG|nr:hypothetical protein BB559_005678 [Furculomyces boomerangus]PVU88893.1 hypothetical protein BB559_005340 [Furculomyces boomerangus]PWA02990.1 hypothetical protein BB558_000857 [Smittium angustum]
MINPESILSFEEYKNQISADPTSIEFALALDKIEELQSQRDEFEFPTIESSGGTKSIDGDLTDKCTYLCGHSLGLMPKRVRKNIAEELDSWSKEGVHAHTSKRYGRPWVSFEDAVVPNMEKIVGGIPGEVTIMSSLTVNMHLLFCPFYNPTPTRNKVLMEAKAFPSDDYAVVSNLKMRGVDPETAVIRMEPREGEFLLRNEDIFKIIEEQGHEIALIWLPGIQYYTGQLFDIEKITKAGHDKGIMVGWDLAHAAGNVPLKLHDWNVDFAVWCTYKYMNSCGGSVGGAFVHSKYATDFERNRLVGWWAHKLDTRFVMDNKMDLIEGIDGFRISNQNVLSSTAVAASLDVFAKTSMEALRARSKVLTAYVEFLLKAMPNTSKNVSIMTSSNPEERGAHLSLTFADGLIDHIFQLMNEHGVVADIRRPNCIRVAPAPLYNNFEDIYKFVRILNMCDFTPNN